MSDPLRDSIQLLRTSAPRVNALTDQTNRVVKQVEEFLSEECRVGTTACVKIEDISDDFSLWLEYRRVNGKFRLAIVYSDFTGDPDTERVTAWAEASRDEKLRAFPKLPELVQKVAENVQKNLQEVEQSVNAVEHIMAALKGTKTASKDQDDDIPF